MRGMGRGIMRRRWGRRHGMRGGLWMRRRILLFSGIMNSVMDIMERVIMIIIDEEVMEMGGRDMDDRNLRIRIRRRYNLMDRITRNRFRDNNRRMDSLIINHRLDNPLIADNLTMDMMVVDINRLGKLI
jgi:hypothetical protein